jgi:GntR family transcriptional repressor for pyruvate dehydrogenase complex
MTKPHAEQEAREKKRPDEIADVLRRKILCGELEAGTDLPGERELSAQLGVSRLTLRAALTRLEAEGLVRPVHGSGNRVLDFRQSGGVELIGHLLSMAQENFFDPSRRDAGVAGQSGLSLLANLLELRRMAAVEAVGMAAERATADDIAAMRANVARQEALQHDPRAYVQADLAFARLLARATHNIAVVFLANTIVGLLAAQPGIEAAFYADPGGSLAVFHKLVDLIESRDAPLARSFAKRLITKLDRHILQQLEAALGAQPDLHLPRLTRH